VLPDNKDFGMECSGSALLSFRFFERKSKTYFIASGIINILVWSAPKALFWVLNFFRENLKPC
jgi:hypothetical protein